MELQQGYNIQCIDWVTMGTAKDGYQSMLPVEFYVDVLGEFIMNLN
jgi:hypothetical protein